MYEMKTNLCNLEFVKIINKVQSENHSSINLQSFTLTPFNRQSKVILLIPYIPTK
jgi:hypothetical protein